MAHLDIDFQIVPTNCKNLIDTEARDTNLKDSKPHIIKNEPIIEITILHRSFVDQNTRNFINFKTDRGNGRYRESIRITNRKLKKTLAHEQRVARRASEK